MLHYLVNPEVARRIDALQIPFSRFGFDSYGVSAHHLKLFFSVSTYFYDNYFCVEQTGVENVPDVGRAMLVGNHSGGIALDAMMVMTCVFWEKEHPRLAQGMADKFLNRLPILSQWTNRVGQLTGLPSHAKRLLEDERLLMVYPEGNRGTAKLFEARRTLVKFGHGFLRLALQTQTPIIPVVFLGGGESIPTIYNSKALGRLFGAPYMPFTPYLLPLPRPVPCEIHFGQPLLFQGDGNEDEDTIQNYVDVVKHKLRVILDEAGAYYDEKLRLWREGERLESMSRHVGQCSSCCDNTPADPTKEEE